MYFRCLAFRAVRGILAGLVAFAVAGCEPNRPEPPQAGQSAGGASRLVPWEVSTPGDEGLSSDSLDRQRERLADHEAAAFLVVRGGSIVYEWYEPGFSATDLHYGSGLAKPLVGSMALVLALNDGLVALEDTAAAYIPAWRGDPVRAPITLRQLATHSSGIENPAEPGKTQRELTGWKREFWRRSGDPISIALHDTPVISTPGTEYHASAAAYAALGYAITASLQGTATPDIRAYLRDRLMRPLAIPDDAWVISYGRPTRIDGMDVYAVWGGVRYTARALARVGQLLLQRGSWRGESLVEADLVERATTYAGDPKDSRGGEILAPALGWFTNTGSTWPEVPADAFVGSGSGHQILAVIQSLDLVIVRFGENPGTDGEAEFWSYVREEIVGPVVWAIED